VSGVPDLTEFESQVLRALVEGYTAREGTKDRIRALNEWEIARRSGATDLSYAAFQGHPARAGLGAALSTLERLGLVAVWERGANYDSFVPTPDGSQCVVGVRPRAAAGPQSGHEAEAGPRPDIDPPGTDLIVERLDEILHLLRSIDARLGKS
jgi:hypothetical protein